MTADGPSTDSPRLHLAWLMWCFSQGYVTAADRAIMTNWLLEDPATMHPDDEALRSHLLAMADEIAAVAELHRPIDWDDQDGCPND